MINFGMTYIISDNEFFKITFRPLDPGFGVMEYFNKKEGRIHSEPFYNSVELFLKSVDVQNQTDKKLDEILKLLKEK